MSKVSTTKKYQFQVLQFISIIENTFNDSGYIWEKQGNEFYIEGNSGGFHNTPKLAVTIVADENGCDVNYQGSIIGMGPLQKRPLVKFVNEIIDLIENSLENIAISEDYNEKQNNTETSGEVDIETKLEKFKSMLDKGLITEEEYQAKKEELLAL